MVSVNCSVFNRSSDKTFFPWSIVSLGVPDITVQQFYDEKVLHCLVEQSKQELNWHFQENQGFSRQDSTTAAIGCRNFYLWSISALLYIQSVPAVTSCGERFHSNDIKSETATTTPPSWFYNCMHTKGWVAQRYFGNAGRRKSVVSRCRDQYIRQEFWHNNGWMRVVCGWTSQNTLRPVHMDTAMRIECVSNPVCRVHINPLEIWCASNAHCVQSTSGVGLEVDSNRIAFYSWFTWGYTYHEIFGLLIG